MKVRFLGAAGTVTGSRFLLESERSRLLLECGLFQGYKHLREQNWRRFPARPADLSAVLLSHAHLDHTGWLPRLVREGFDGPVHASRGTCDLLRILLPDSARLMEEDAERANVGGYSKHHPALPLYTEDDAKAALRLLRPVATGRDHEAGPFTFRFVPNGHILGSSSVAVEAEGVRLLHSGDVGRPLDPVMPPPEDPVPCDALLLDSTYGDRRHDPADPAEGLAAEVRRAAERNGVLLVPAFAVGRTMAILVLLERLRRAGRIPDLPVHVDSPMAIRASRLLLKEAPLTRVTPDEARAIERRVHWVSDARDSMALDKEKGPFILVSASGMLAGGRVLHHLKAFGPERRNTILLPGHQAAGTRGARLLAGEKEVKVHGRMVPVRARALQLGNLSGHADQEELLAWAARIPTPPERTFLIHGEPDAADALRARVQDRLGWKALAPQMGEAHSLGAKAA